MPPNFRAVEKLGEFSIPVKGMDIGNHRFLIEIDDSFFEQMQFSDINTGVLSLELNIEKESSLFVFDFSFTGFVELVCDRCLDKYTQDLSGTFRLIFKNSDHFEEISDEVIEIPADESRINIAQYVYEFINLMIPIKKVHPDDENGFSTCNPEMLNRLNDFQEPKPDSRWDKLKNITFD